MGTFENFNLPPFLDSLTTPVAGRNLHCSLAYFLGSMLSSLQKITKNQEWLNIYFFFPFFGTPPKKGLDFLGTYQQKETSANENQRRLAKVPAL